MHAPLTCLNGGSGFLPLSLSLSIYIYIQYDLAISMFVSAEEFSEILDAMQNRRLDGITIKFRAANHPQIFDDTKHGLDSKNFGIKLLTNLDYLELDVDQEELPINWQNFNDFTTDFTILVYTNKTVL